MSRAWSANSSCTRGGWSPPRWSRLASAGGSRKMRSFTPRGRGTIRSRLTLYFIVSLKWSWRERSDPPTTIMIVNTTTNEHEQLSCVHDNVFSYCLQDCEAEAAPLQTTHNNFWGTSSSDQAPSQSCPTPRKFVPASSALPGPEALAPRPPSPPKSWVGQAQPKPQPPQQPSQRSRSRESPSLFAQPTVPTSSLGTYVVQCLFSFFAGRAGGRGRGRGVRESEKARRRGREMGSLILQSFYL